MLTRRQLIVACGALTGGVATGALTRERKGAADARSPLRNTFQPGEIWVDTGGKPFQAHGGSILEVEDRYYWYGENKEFTTGKTDVWTWGVRCYGSTDLYNWDDLGLIIPPDKDDPTSPLNPAAKLDRPHILYNPRRRSSSAGSS